MDGGGSGRARHRDEHHHRGNTLPSWEDAEGGIERGRQKKRKMRDRSQSESSSSGVSVERADRKKSVKKHKKKEKKRKKKEKKKKKKKRKETGSHSHRDVCSGSHPRRRGRSHSSSACPSSDEEKEIRSEAAVRDFEQKQWRCGDRSRSPPCTQRHDRMEDSKRAFVVEGGSRGVRGGRLRGGCPERGSEYSSDPDGMRGNRPPIGQFAREMKEMQRLRDWRGAERVYHRLLAAGYTPNVIFCSQLMSESFALLSCFARRSSPHKALTSNSSSVAFRIRHVCCGRSGREGSAAFDEDEGGHGTPGT